jgi:probable HAF family extracellular repeat protein
MNKSLRTGVVAALGVCASFALAPLVAQNSVIDVGTLGFGSSYLLAVNNRNEAVGYSEVMGLDSNRAMLWRDGQLIDLGVLPGMMLSSAEAINDRGDIVGWSSEYQYQRIQAVLWRDGQTIDLTPSGFYPCRARDINNRGDIVGDCGGAVLWRTGTGVPVATYIGGFTPLGINDAGVIVGTRGSTPVRWTNGTIEALPLPAGALGGVAASINGRGQIVGYVINPSFYDPVIWEDGRVRPLGGAWGLVYGYARRINERGEVAVHAFTGPITEFGGQIWRDGVFHHLESSATARDINERGVAVGAVSLGFEQHGAVWPKALTRVPPPGPVR